MKQFSLLFALTSFVFSSQSFALVALKAQCTTVDGQYQVNIVDNQGIGPIRSSNLGVTVLDSDGQVVASYGLIYVNPLMRSVSFGTSVFKDKDTNGQNFSLTTGSTNFGPRLMVKLTDGTHTGSVITDDKIECKFY